MAISDAYCPTCLTKLTHRLTGTGYDNYGWCEKCNMWKNGES